MKTGKSLFMKCSQEQQEIASLTKIMTATVVLEFLKDLSINPKLCYMEVSEKASRICGTTACLKKGMLVSVYDLLHGMLLPSGNDAAYCLAENMGLYFHVFASLKIGRMTD
jgi:D-alanyl-D-alanine carboxypeptidase (penicillin-binding protein 5/6)